jgi:NADH-quinone oxidoreductase subunit M
MLFLLVGMIYQRRHTRQIDELGGLFAVMPIWTTVLMVATLGSIGLPGTNGFVGEFLILLGTFRMHPTAAALATFGIVLAAVYMLWMLQRVVFGRLSRPENLHLTDISWRERLVLVPLVILVFWMGVYPQAFLSKMQPALDRLLGDVYARQTAMHPDAAKAAGAAHAEVSFEHP